MKQKINVNDYADLITAMLPKGVLLNTQGEKFNSMVIGWGHLGTLWGKSTFVVYVRQSRYTKKLIDEAKEFSVSVPLKEIDPKIFKICGTMSGRDIDKVREAGLTLVDGETIRTPAVKEYPLTLECKVLYQQDQDLGKIPEEIVNRMYADGDFHTMYVGEIVDAYIIQ
ncbi:MAG: flavin reductase [Lachnospiraceae bacterium]|nr:flavin reductase [Lachnospiraceae bacterium]